MHPRVPFIVFTCLSLAGCGGTSPDLVDARGPGVDGSPAADAADVADAPPLQDFFGLQFVDPDHGSFAGGTIVMVRGFGFDESTNVMFGGRTVEPLNLEVVDTRRILVRTPPGEPGLADVQVQKDDDTATLTDGYSYEPIHIDPPVGSVAGGTFVTITGLGTDFGPGTSVTFDGLEMTGIDILGEQGLTGFSPVGTAGTADVRVTTATAVYEADRGFTYQATGDPFFGGMSGGPIDGTVNVVVIDSATDNGIPDAYVVIGDPATSAYQGTTDFLGQITFSAPGLTGPITVSTTAENYELASFVEYDAQNITIFLRRPPEPFNGPPPPAPQTGHIFGHVLFGDATTLGSPYWDIVPEPRTPTERKRLYVTTAARNLFGSAFAPTKFIDYQYNQNVVAWEFDAWVRPSATAVVAIAGLYDPERDPSGVGSTGFEPFAMGVTRGVLVGPGETVLGVDVVVNIPLDSAVQVELDAPPALDTPGWDGPNYYKVRPFIDLGGEGVILMNKNGMATPPAPEARPNHYRFELGTESILLSGMSPLVGNVSDASYGFIVGAYTETDTNPYTVRVVRGITDMSSPVIVGDFLGTPRQLDPEPDGVASTMGLSFQREGPSAGPATFNLHLLTSTDGVQLARILTRGDIFDVAIPDMTYGGLPPFPTGVDVSWTMWNINATGYTFDEFTYRQLSALYWESYAADSTWVQFPLGN